MVAFKINGRSVEAADGSYILSSARALGLDIPAPCDYPSLEPHGACRLCIVEVTHPGWPGWRKLVTSCNYPVSEGLEVHTNTPQVREHRQELLRMLLARCPETEMVQRLARRYGGIAETPYVRRAEVTHCILCDMCVRVCGERSTSALAHAGRGTERKINPPTDDCVGCGACALVCPTECIPFERSGERTSVWGREFPVAYCAVDPDKCRACGLCEENCYFDVARVKLFATGRLTSFIDKASCQGCGSCIAVCPTGAISMQSFGEAELLARICEMAAKWPRVVAFACPRSPIPDELAESVIILPCIGRVSLAMMMAAVLAGARKAVLIGRDAESCCFGEGERQAVKRAELAQKLAKFMQLGEERVEVISAPPGLHGPAEALKHIFAANYPASAFEQAPALGLAEAGYDALAARLREICASGVAPDLSDWPARIGAAERGDTVLYVNRIAVLDCLVASLTNSHALRDVAAGALGVMAAAGIPCRIAAGSAGCSGEGKSLEADVESLKESGAKRVVALCPESAKAIGNALKGIEVTSLDDYLVGLARSSAKPAQKLKVACAPGFPPLSLPGVEWVSLPDDMHIHGLFTFRLAPGQREGYVRALAEATLLGADYVLCRCPAEYLQVKLLLREGAWRMSRVEPVTLASLACILLGGGKDER